RGERDRAALRGVESERGSARALRVGGAGASTSRTTLPSNEQGFAIARDGTKLFVRSRTAGHPAGAVRAMLCDGIVCDGFIWKYLWDDLAPTAPLTHWHYRGHGRSAAPVDPDRIDIPAHADDLSRVRQFVGNPPCV